LVAIGEIGDERVVGVVRGAGADCVAVIGAVTEVEDVKVAVDNLNEAMR
jgi:thiamine monophosphate synthase